MTPDRMQRLLNDAVWDTTAAMGVSAGSWPNTWPRRPEGWRSRRWTSRQEKKGSATAGVKRQYMGCAGQVANGINTVHCSYATRGGHALIGARLYLPAELMALAGSAQRCLSKLLSSGRGEAARFGGRGKPWGR